MTPREPVTVGMPVYGADEQSIGTVEATDGDGFRVGGRQIPAGAIARVADGSVYLEVTGAALESRADTPLAPGDAALPRRDGDTIVIPLAEERLVLGTREIDLGEIIVRKRIVEEERLVPVTLRREVIEVVRRDADGHQTVDEVRPDRA